MNNTINVNYMTRTYSNFLKNNEAKGGRTEGLSFVTGWRKKAQLQQKRKRLELFQQRI